MFQYPEIYKTGISVSAVDNLLFYDNIYEERYMGLPQENMDNYVKGSPIYYAKNLKGNLLFIHGTGDDNVHYDNAEAMLNELIKYNKKFQFMPYPNRTHSISEGEGTFKHLSTLYSDFLRKNCPREQNKFLHYIWSLKLFKMRTLVIITSLLVLCIFNSCQKEFENPNDPSGTTTADFRAKISGVQFVAAISGAAILTDSIISLAGKSNDGQMIAFSVADSGVHVYNLEFNSFSNVGSYVTSNSLAYHSNEGATPAESGGNLAIVSIDTVKRLISGTFNFKAFRQADGTQRVITEGVFNNIPY